MRSLKRFACVLVALLCIASVALADQNLWVVCQPDSYVNLHRNPSRKSETIGRCDSGDMFVTDGVWENGYVHVYDVSCEFADGWISEGYVVYGEPEYLGGAKYEVKSNGRVATRRSIDGKRRHWLKKGAIVNVYWMSKTWSVTNYGFVMTEYLEAVNETKRND